VHTTRNITPIVLSDMLRRAVHVACVTDTKNFYEILEASRAVLQAADHKMRSAYKE
jgi:hypothetical protein